MKTTIPITCWLLVASVIPGPAQFVLDDGEFQTNNWEFRIRQENANSHGTASVERREAGGSSGAFRQTVIRLPRFHYSGTHVHHFLTHVTFDPRLNGGLVAIKYSMDILAPNSGVLNTDVGVGLTLRQGTNVYSDSAWNGSGQAFNTSQWRSFTKLRYIDELVPEERGANLSESMPISFGFTTSAGYWLVAQADPSEFTVGVDNFRVVAFGMPHLSIAIVGSKVRISWPNTELLRIGLETTECLCEPWIPSTLAAARELDDTVIYEPLGASGKFFRLNLR